MNCKGHLQSMERGSIYVDGEHAIGTGAESPRSITSRGSGGGPVAKSRKLMQELTPFGKNRGAHSKKTSRTGEFQARRSVVGGRKGGRMLRGGGSSSSLPMAIAGSRGSIPPSAVDASECQGTKCTQESKGEVSDSTAFGCVTKRRRSRNKLPKDK